LTLTFNLLTLKVVSESCVMWATSVPIFVFIDLSVLDLGPMYARGIRQTSDRRQTGAYKTLTTVTCHLANYALETLAERQLCCWNCAIERRSCLVCSLSGAGPRLTAYVKLHPYLTAFALHNHTCYNEILIKLIFIQRLQTCFFIFLSRF